MNDRLPAPQQPAPVAPRAGLLPQGLAYDAASDLAQAYAAVAAGESDVSIRLQATVVCDGDTAADALQAAADFTRRSPRAQLHSTASAKVPGPVDDTWSYRVTLIVSYPDHNGEYTGDTHHADPQLPDAQHR